MKKIIVAFLIFISLSPLVNATYLEDDGFENNSQAWNSQSTVVPWGSICSDLQFSRAFSRSSSVVRSGNYSARFAVADTYTGCASGARMELISDRFYWVNTTKEVEGDSRWYSHSFYLDPSSYLVTNTNQVYWMIFAQWHGGQSLSPHAAFHIRRNTSSGPLQLVFTRCVGYDADGMGACPDSNIDIIDSNFQSGIWYDTAFRINWSKNPTGSVTIWKKLLNEYNYTEVFNEQNIATLQTTDEYPNGLAAARKHGIYKYDGGLDILYYDDFKMATTQEEVMPSVPPSEYMPPSPINCNSIVGRNWINVSCSAGAGNVTNEFRYLNLNASEWKNGTTLWQNFTGLLDGTSYYFEAYSYNSSGTGSINTSYTSINNITTLLPILTDFQILINGTEVVGGHTTNKYYNFSVLPLGTYNVSIRVHNHDTGVFSEWNNNTIIIELIDTTIQFSKVEFLWWG